MYFDRMIVVRIGTKVTASEISMRGFLPGYRSDIVAVSTEGIHPGTYSIEVGLACPGSQTPDIKLAI